MVSFSSERLSKAVMRLYAPGTEQMYLVEGSQRAALIDTGTGAGDLRGYVESLTKLPLIVLMTHNHFDHAMGSIQFDIAYMSAPDIATFNANRADPDRKTYMKDSPYAAEVEDADYVPIDDPARYRVLEDKARFDLGGVTLEAIRLAGHTVGSTIFLLHEERTLILGDAVGNFTMMQNPTSLGLTSYIQNLECVRAYTEGKYDRLYLSHDALTPPLDLFSQMILLCKEIQTGHDDKVPYSYMDTHGFIAKRCGPIENGPYGSSKNCRNDGGFANVIYNPERLFE